MKLRFLIIISVVFTSCFLFRKKVEYNIPDSVTAEDKKKIIKDLNKGRVHYYTYCAKCHNTDSTGKRAEPKFTPWQLDAYKVRRQNKDHSVSLSSDKISDEDLEKIVMYFRLKK